MTGDKKAHARNKSSDLAVLNNEFERAVKFSLVILGYRHILSTNRLIFFFFFIASNSKGRLDLARAKH